MSFPLLTLPRPLPGVSPQRRPLWYFTSAAPGARVHSGLSWSCETSWTAIEQEKRRCYVRPGLLHNSKNWMIYSSVALLNYLNYYESMNLFLFELDWNVPDRLCRCYLQVQACCIMCNLFNITGSKKAQTINKTITYYVIIIHFYITVRLFTQTEMQ